MDRKQVQELAKNILPFSAAQRTHFFWHEVKRYLTLTGLQLNNIANEAYGEVPGDIKQPVFDLRLFNFANFSWIENILVLDKIANGQFISRTELTDVKKFIERCAKVCSSVVLVKQLSISCQILPENNQVNLDQRYTKQMISNSIFTMTECMKENKTLSLRSKIDKDQITFEISAENQDLIEEDLPAEAIFDSNILYSPTDNVWLKHSLDMQMNKVLTYLLGGEFSIERDSKRTTIFIKLNLI